MKTLKYFLISFLLLAFFVPLQAQSWDSTYRPAIYPLLVDQFKSFPKSNKDIIFLGNSITAGIDWSELLQLPEARNRGISGDISFGVLERLDDVITGKPQKIFILIGINDISRNIPDDTILNNYEKIVDRIQKHTPQTKIFFQTLLPVNSSFEKFKNHYGKDEHILYVNEGIRKLTKEKGIYLIDLYPHFLDDNNRLKASLTHDGLHLRIEGYRLWANILKDGGYLDPGK
ncbi:GDSL-type esterase/lipase family protein [Olivibacter sp. XZL3]|uniref:GDSL-type esterase/lipase family protein n=1 Tax=Olivibacter sp. XZL3 TaxID=1735116 RepID=UPI001064E002|nr:GDSL-type esterase/lipase family protein [Olivibacter sp. XZL3]